MSEKANQKKSGVKRQTTLFHSNAVKKVLYDKKKKKKVYVDIDEEEQAFITKKPARTVLECVCHGCEKAFANHQGLSSHKLQ